ncbi:hypothetical protein C8F01DRAFT_571359 [Mycena amicta]|nr:hypothetical protein C8F01DRAFT_571359 [Mycena amicta]
MEVDVVDTGCRNGLSLLTVLLVVALRPLIVTSFVWVIELVSSCSIPTSLPSSSPPTFSSSSLSPSSKTMGLSLLLAALLPSSLDPPALALLPVCVWVCVGETPNVDRTGANASSRETCW